MCHEILLPFLLWSAVLYQGLLGRCLCFGQARKMEEARRTCAR